jgi:hypothetical protein
MRILGQHPGLKPEMQRHLYFLVLLSFLSSCVERKQQNFVFIFAGEHPARVGLTGWISSCVNGLKKNAISMTMKLNEVRGKIPATDARVTNKIGN